METDPSAPENSDQAVISSTSTPDDEKGGASSTTQLVATSRSYECTFCKRGFSNAQALGGHMNIHRKDKAKLKQSSSSTTTHETTKSFTPPLDLYSPYSDSIVVIEPSHEEIIKNTSTTNIDKNWPSIFSTQGHDHHILHGSSRDETSGHLGHQQQLQKLPLFSETATSREREKQETSSKSGQEQLGSEVLDLELRLGHHHEPKNQDSSEPKTKTTGTKKFF